MFDQGFGPDLRKFLAPLKNRAAKPGDQGFQTVLVTATMTKVLCSSIIPPRHLFDQPFKKIIFAPLSDCSYECFSLSVLDLSNILYSHSFTAGCTEVD
jgi:hypothetical protein